MKYTPHNPQKTNNIIHFTRLLYLCLISAGNNEYLLVNTYKTQAQALLSGHRNVGGYPIIPHCIPSILHYMYKLFLYIQYIYFLMYMCVYIYIFMCIYNIYIYMYIIYYIGVSILMKAYEITKKKKLPQSRCPSFREWPLLREQFLCFPLHTAASLEEWPWSGRTLRVSKNFSEAWLEAEMVMECVMSWAGQIEALTNPRFTQRNGQKKHPFWR